MPTAPTTRSLLVATLPAKHVDAALKHYSAAIVHFQQSKWEQAIASAGKLVEAVMKALSVHTGGTLPPARQFKVAAIITQLKNLPGGTFNDTVRITIPRATEFVYDIASNRGARHDPTEVDPNEMDATAVMSTVSWIIAELVRYSQKGSVTPGEAKRVIAGLVQRRMPLVEEVDDRTYFHIPGIGARDVALLLLWKVHPNRLTGPELRAGIERHGFTKGNALTAITRIGGVVDSTPNGRRLLAPGIAEAEALLQSTETAENS